MIKGAVLSTRWYCGSVIFKATRVERAVSRDFAEVRSLLD